MIITVPLDEYPDFADFVLESDMYMLCLGVFRNYKSWQNDLGRTVPSSRTEVHDVYITFDMFGEVREEVRFQVTDTTDIVTLELNGYSKYISGAIMHG